MSRNSSALSLFVLAFALVFSGCTQGAQTDSASQKLAEAQKLAFAYDTTFDQITYMSCQHMPTGGSAGAYSFDRNSYFTLRAGAHRQGGLMLKNEFFEALKKKSPERMLEMLQDSKANTSTAIQMAVRDGSTLQQILTTSGAEKKGDDFMNLFVPLGSENDPSISDALIKQPVNARMKYLRNGEVRGARIEGSLYFTSSPSIADDVRRRLTNGHLLTLTYTDYKGIGQEIKARSPGTVIDGNTTDINRFVFGKGYTMTFSQPDKVPHFDNATAAISTSVQQVVPLNMAESNLLGPTDTSPKGTWLCPRNLQFRIVRYEDAKTVGCSREPDPMILSEDLRRVRDHLRAEDWYVDMTNRCIVNKKADGKGCYGDYKYVQYDLTGFCNQAPAQTDNVNNKACVSYASVCYRQN